MQAQLIRLLRVGEAGALPTPLCLLACTTGAVGCAATGIGDGAGISPVQDHPSGSCSDISQDSCL